MVLSSPGACCFDCQLVLRSTQTGRKVAQYPEISSSYLWDLASLAKTAYLHRVARAGAIFLFSVLPTSIHQTILQACGASGADETYCLDDCSGMEAEMPEVDEFKYRYYLVRI